MKLKFSHLTLASLLLGPGLAYPAYHQIKAGDTLTQIAESNYGNWVKWRDLWKLNQDNISNPDLIYPGQRLRLLTDEELARFVKNDVMPGRDLITRNDANPEALPTRSRARKSQEWRLLPQQNWERFVFRNDPSVDPDGFDRRSKVAPRIADKATANVTIASDRIPVLGEVTNARSEYKRLFLGDQLFVRADEQLQVGTTYSITTGPQKIVSRRDSRVGFGYDLMGKVKIIGVRDGLFIGTIVAIYFPIQRHQLLIPEVKDYVFPDAVAAPSALPASIVIPAGAKEDLLGQEKIVLLDVGSEDGVKPGMIFRHYLHTDPNTHEEISAKDFLIEAELKVLSVQSKFSVAIILQSHSILHFGNDVVALTDLGDFEKNQGLQTILQDSATPTTVDDLDQLDANDGLGEHENRDLRQLEKWNKPTPSAGTINSNDSDEIQRIDPQGSRPTYDIGQEPAPNDGTSNRPQTAPNPKATPAPTPAPEPEVMNPNAPPLLDANPDAVATPAPTPADVDLNANPTTTPDVAATPAPTPIPSASPVPSSNLDSNVIPADQNSVETIPSEVGPSDTASPSADPFATPTPSK